VILTPHNAAILTFPTRRTHAPNPACLRSVSTAPRFPTDSARDFRRLRVAQRLALDAAGPRDSHRRHGAERLHGAGPQGCDRAARGLQPAWTRGAGHALGRGGAAHPAEVGVARPRVASEWEEAVRFGRKRQRKNRNARADLRFRLPGRAALEAALLHP